MKLKLPSDQRARLELALRHAGTKEIGGQMYGEQLAVSEFSASELVIQPRPGSFARFVVDLLQAAKDAVRFFDRTRHQYTRFNYIGEWHSHPSFAVRPSGTDLETMRELVQDGRFVGSFAILMIVRLDGSNMSAAAWYFDPLGNEGNVVLEIDE